MDGGDLSAQFDAAGAEMLQSVKGHAQAQKLLDKRLAPHQLDARHLQVLVGRIPGPLGRDDCQSLLFGNADLPPVRISRR